MSNIFNYFRFFTFIFFLSGSSICTAQKIYWQEGQKLTWRDFQAKSNITGQKNTLAYAYCGIGYQVTKSTNPKAPVRVKITTVFDISKSWKSSDQLSAYVLEHEQLHFDIAELFSRKMRKMVSEKIKTSADYDRYFQLNYNALYREYREMQDTYDRETRNSIDKEKQAFYNSYISAELQKLNTYST